MEQIDLAYLKAECARETIAAGFLGRTDKEFIRVFPDEPVEVVILSGQFYERVEMYADGAVVAR